VSRFFTVILSVMLSIALFIVILSVIVLSVVRLNVMMLSGHGAVFLT
jgi:hypothetical protein